MTYRLARTVLMALLIAPGAAAFADTPLDPFALGPSQASASGASSREVRELRQRLEDLENRIDSNGPRASGPMTDDMLIRSLRQRDLGQGSGMSSNVLAGSEPVGLVNGRHFVKVAGQYLEVTAEQFADVASAFQASGSSRAQADEALGALR